MCSRQISLQHTALDLGGARHVRSSSRPNESPLRNACGTDPAVLFAPAALAGLPIATAIGRAVRLAGTKNPSPARHRCVPKRGLRRRIRRRTQQTIAALQPTATSARSLPLRQRYSPDRAASSLPNGPNAKNYLSRFFSVDSPCGPLSEFPASSCGQYTSYDTQ